eukprot:4844908-Lingulodinium_polyedra.AAC.1
MASTSTSTLYPLRFTLYLYLYFAPDLYLYLDLHPYLCPLPSTLYPLPSTLHPLPLPSTLCLCSTPLHSAAARYTAACCSVASA